MVRTQHTKAAFTLVEILLATVVGALVVTVTVLTLQTASAARTRLAAFSETTAAGRYALARIREDLAGLYLGPDAGPRRFIGQPGRRGQQTSGRFSAYVVSDASHAPPGEEAGGDVFEVEYGLMAEPSGPPSLVRRWAPVLDLQRGNTEGDFTRVAAKAVGLEFAYFDGRQWRDYWEGGAGIPLMVRVTLEMDAGDRTMAMSQVVSLRAAGERGLAMPGESPEAERATPSAEVRHAPEP